MLAEKKLAADIRISGSEDLKISGITYDSRKAEQGSLFVCKGASFNEEYLKGALEKGSVAYVSEKRYEKANAPHIIVNDVRGAMPHIARLFYDIPEDFNVIGITGTKGKTTAAYYLKSIFDEEARLKKRGESAFISTVETYDGVERINTGITTPEAFELYRHFHNAASHGIDRMVMEVSSQALKYRRTDGIVFDTAVFLNISEDHISPIEHPDFEDYFSSKLKIFSQCSTAVINRQSDSYERVACAAASAEKVVTFGFDEGADFRAYDLRREGSKEAFKVGYGGKEYAFRLNMHGRYNVENALAAIATAFKYDVPYEVVYTALDGVSVPGRGEEYESTDGNIRVIVDYAHNGLSFKTVLNEARKNWPSRRIVTVFGCPGGKGLNRRRDMGLAAGELSDEVYLTADDPAGENVADICAQIGHYIEKTGCPYVVVEDRCEAVRRAIQGCKLPSVVLLLGKGSEMVQKTASGDEYYISDARAAKNALDAL